MGQHGQRKREELETIFEAVRARFAHKVYRLISPWCSFYILTTAIHISDLQHHNWHSFSATNLQIYTCDKGCCRYTISPPAILSRIQTTVWVRLSSQLPHRGILHSHLGALRDHTSFSFWFTNPHPARKKMALCLPSIGIKSRFITPWERDQSRSSVRCYANSDATSSILWEGLCTSIIVSSPSFLAGIVPKEYPMYPVLVLWEYAGSTCNF